MQFEVFNRPGNCALRSQLAPSETVVAEGGSMICMSSHLQVTTTTMKRNQGSLLAAGKRLLTGESFFLNHFHADSGGGEVWFAPRLPGDIVILDPTERPIIVQAGSFLCADESLDMDSSWQGIKSLFAGEWAFWIKFTGSGKLAANSFGEIYPVQVDGEYFVDTGHIVAFTEGLNFSVTKLGDSWIGSFLGGEGLVTKFQGHGTVWCQSHNMRAYGSALGSLLRARS